MKRTLLFILLAGVLFASCSKEIIEPPKKEPPKQEILSNAQWPPWCVICWKCAQPGAMQGCNNWQLHCGTNWPPGEPPPCPQTYHCIYAWPETCQLPPGIAGANPFKFTAIH